MKSWGGEKKNHSIREKKYDNMKQPFVLAGGCIVSIIQRGSQLLPADVLLNALVSSDLHDAAINASICRRASQARDKICRRSRNCYPTARILRDGLKVRAKQMFVSENVSYVRT